MIVFASVCSSYFFVCDILLISLIIYSVLIFCSYVIRVHVCTEEIIESHARHVFIGEKIHRNPIHRKNTPEADICLIW